MKRKHLFNATLAIILVIAITFSTLSVSAVANMNNDLQVSKVQNDVKASGTNSLGTMLANELEDKNKESNENNGCNIYSIAVSDNNAVISFQTVMDATVLVAIYNESCDTLIATGTTTVEKGETEKNVVLDTDDIPQYFYVKGYLIDTDTNKPLCTAYSSPMYTKEMQEFLSKTTDDFDKEKVLNFDNNKKNNFAVYKDNVKLIEESNDKNRIIKSDDSTKTYVIENIDNNISSLKAGDTFSYNHSNGNALIVKVSSIIINGTTATIVGENTKLNDVFDYLKIDDTANSSKYSYDNSNMSDALKLESSTIRNRSSRAIDFGYSPSWSKSFSLKYKQDDISITGSIDVGFTISTKIYISLSFQYMEFISKKSLGINLDIDMYNFKKEFPIGTVMVSPVIGLDISLKINFVIEGEIDYKVNTVISSQFGFSYSSDDGFRNLSKSPSPSFGVKVKGKLFLGLNLSLEAKFLGLIARAGISGDIGLELSLQKSDTGIHDTYKHDCVMCKEGEIDFKLSFSAYVNFFDSESLQLEKSFSEQWKLCDIYYSLDDNSFGFTTCPRISYKVTVTVKDNSGNPVDNALIGGKVTTDNNGKAVLWLSNGNHRVTSQYLGAFDIKNFKVNNSEIAVNFTLKISNPKFEPLEIVQTAAGGSHSAAIAKNGSLYEWGDNSDGQVGDGTTISRYTPTKIMDNVISVSLGGNHSAAITKDGSLYMWGENRYGQLGDGTTTDRYTPTKIMDNIISVSLGYDHSAAITKDGSLYMWGENRYGQLGDGTITNRYTPTKIMDSIASVSLGSGHSAAITKDKILFTWGLNSAGQLGNDVQLIIPLKEIIYKNTPQMIMENVTSVNLGGDTTAIIKDGDLYMCGYGGKGQLGNGGYGRYLCQSTPKKLMENISFANIGSDTSAAITQNGTLYIWGSNWNGELGDGTTNTRVTPTKIMDNVIYVSLGLWHSTAITKGGNLYMWGRNTFGELGDGTTQMKTSPELINIYRDDVQTFNSTKKSSESVSSSSDLKQREAKFSGYTPNSVYNFYSLKDKNAYNLLSNDNILYIEQVESDKNGTISVKYTPKTSYNSPYEFVTSITRIDISNAKVTTENLTYNGELQEVKPKVEINGCTLYEGIDYTLSGEQFSRNAGELTYTVLGKGDYIGSLTQTSTINALDINTCEISDIPSAKYSGEAVEPDVTVKNGSVTLKKDSDYVLEYKNNFKVGNGIVVIKGIGNYGGAVEKTFKIETTTGDVDLNGVIDVRDSTRIMEYAVELIEFSNEQIALADVNNDKIINVKDASIIQKYIVRLISSFAK